MKAPLFTSLVLLALSFNTFAGNGIGDKPATASKVEIAASESKFALNAEEQLFYSLHSSLFMAEESVEQLEVELGGDSQASNVLLLSLATAVDREVNISITDLQKTTVFAKGLTKLQAGQNYRALNVTSIPEGNYIMTIEQDGKKQIKLIGIVTEESFN